MSAPDQRVCGLVVISLAIFVEDGRSLAVLHVASAIELELKNFVSFDLRQQQLARAAGLKLVVPAA